MYVIFTHANNWEEVSITLTSDMTNVQDWLIRFTIEKKKRKTVHDVCKTIRRDDKFKGIPQRGGA